MNRHQKTIDALTILNQRKAWANQRRHGAVGVLTPATTTAEQSHAQTIIESAATMRAKGYSTQAITTLEGGIASLLISGPTSVAFEASETLEECPPYVCLADYLLASYEQDAE